ncbi:penicillin-binding protein activator [Alphaproteobacteria bacterium LSUCC0684]
MAGCNTSSQDTARTTTGPSAPRLAVSAPVTDIKASDAEEVRPAATTQSGAQPSAEDLDPVLEMIKSASSISEETGDSIQQIVSALEKISVSDDNVGVIIDNLIKRDEAEAAETPQSPEGQVGEEKGVAAIAAEEPREDDVKPAELVIPEGRDPSLAPEALAAAFALIRPKATLNEDLAIEPVAPIPIPEKPEGGFRIAILAPYTGPAAAIGQRIRKGAELALFELQLQQVDLIFQDTASGAEAAVLQAVRDQADLILGPVFAEDTRKAWPFAQAASVPMISFSNDLVVARPGLWILGQTPEQEIETALAYALQHVKPNPKSGRRDLAIALVEQDSVYGRRVANHANEILLEAGIGDIKRLTINAETRSNEAALRRVVRNFVQWRKSSNGSSSRVPVFDLVIMAGDNTFSLGVAPVLAWYDLDPEKVRYLGTSIWDDAATLQEPSLAGAWYANAPRDQHGRFAQLWAKTSGTPADRLSMLGFDAVALVGTIVREKADLYQELTNPIGFSGFSGMFRLLPDGRNLRLLDVREINDSTSTIIAPGPESF